MQQTSQPIINLIYEMKQYFQSSPTELSQKEEFEDFEFEANLTEDPSSYILQPDIKSMIFNLQGVRSGNFGQMYDQLSIQPQQQDQIEIFETTQCSFDDSEFSSYVTNQEQNQNQEL